MDAPATLLTAAAWVLGGLGLFLFGVDVLSGALRDVAGRRLREIVARSTRSRWTGLLLGAAVTALLQSSSASTVLFVSLVNAGLLTLEQSAGLILGTGIGSTLTAQLITVSWMEDLALWAIGLGAVLYLFVPGRSFRRAGRLLLGFGLIFFGFSVMKTAVAPWRDTVIRAWFASLASPSPGRALIAVLAAALATAVVQSSAATVGLILAMADQGVVPGLSAAMPLVVGCHIGTAVTAVLASIGTTVAARRTAACHVLFRVLSAALTLVLLPLYAWAVPRTAAGLSHQIANFNTLHSLVSAMALLPAAGLATRVLRRAIRGEDAMSPAPLFLNFARKLPPHDAYRQALRESIRLAVLVRDMIRDAVLALTEGRERLADSVLRRETIVDGLHETIVQYVLALIRRQEFDPRDDDPVVLLQVLHHIERVGDHAENLVELTDLLATRGEQMDTDRRAEIRETAALVDVLAGQLIAALRDRDPAAVAAADQARDRLKALARRLMAACLRAVQERRCPPVTATVYEDALANLDSSGRHLRGATRIFLGQPPTPEENPDHGS